MIYKLKQQKDKFIEKAYYDSMKSLNKFYKIKWAYGRPNVVTVESRKQIDELKDVKTESWVVGWSDNKTIYILDRKKMKTESCHIGDTEKTYIALLKHEISHAFFHILSKGKYNPRWLCEGVAIYTSGQNIFKKPLIKFTNFLDFFNKGGGGIYYESGFAVELLVKKYGKGKLLKLISGLAIINDKQDFSKLFMKIYNFNPNYTNFNNLLTK